MNRPEAVEQVREAFDSIAGVFDETYENEITRRLRSSLYKTVVDLVPSGGSILDISCGTGIDAIELSRRGFRVTASDVSPMMVERARTKASSFGLREIAFRVTSMENLEDMPNTPFDLVLSNFGALNCLQDMNNTARSVAAVTRPGGYFLAVVMPRLCLWELAAGLSRANPSFAFRRFRHDVQATGFQQGTFTVHYHPLPMFRSAFRQWFDPVGTRGWCVVAPPPHATGFASKFPRFTRSLTAVDNVVGGFPLFRAAGDHYLCILKRKAGRTEE